MIWNLKKINYKRYQSEKNRLNGVIDALNKTIDSLEQRIASREMLYTQQN